MNVVPVAVARITDPEMDRRMEEEFNWHKLNGLKLRNCKAKVADGEFMLRMIMLAVVLEPIRWLARWIIGQSGEMYLRSAACAGLAQATCDCTSPFVAVLQYYSRLLRGHGARLELVWRSASCSSYAEWCRSCQDQVQLLRRVILNASGWVYRRHIKELSKFPWKWASLGNVANVDDAVADQVIEDFMSRRACCYRPGFARRLLNSFNGNLERGTKCKRNCCHCGRCYAKHKSTKLAKKTFSFQFRISFFVCLSTILIEVNTMESILFRGVILATSSGQ